MNEEERAALYREQVASRAQARREQYVGLAGNRARREALDLAWRPPVLARLEAQSQGDDHEFLEEMFVDVPQRDIFVSGEAAEDQLA